MSTAVKLIHSGMAGAPTLANVAGNLVAVLNAALVDGFGANTVDSIVIAGGVATVTRGAGHPFEVGAVALISGATTTSGSINGEQRVLSVAGATYTFDATGIGNQTATGTITHKVAPLGWGRPFTGSSTLQVYRSADVTGTRLYLRVDDTGTTNGRVVGYETMSDDSSGTGPFPTAAQQSGGLYWPKSGNSTLSTWAVVGDGRYFHLWVAVNSVGGGASFTSGFGDYLARKAPGPFECLISGSSTNATGFTFSTQCLSYSNAAAGLGLYVARGVSGVGGATTAARTAVHPRAASGLYSGEGSGSHYLYPDPSGNRAHLVPYSISEVSPAVSLRGEVPGAFYFPHNVGTGAGRAVLSGIEGHAGRVFKPFGTYNGVFFLDTMGPWR